MRHAKSDWSSAATHDIDRPLNQRGRKDTPRMARWLIENDYRPGLIASSPSCRTRQTVELLNRSLKLEDKDLRWDDRLYHPSVDGLLEVLNEFDNDNESATVMLLSHNPGLEQLLSYIGRGELHYSASGKLLPTAAVAVLEHPENSGPVAEASCQIEQIVRPRELAS